MNISRYIDEKAVKLEMSTAVEPLEEGASYEKWLAESKENVLEELVKLLEKNYRIGNFNKLLIDFINRERKASTAIGDGIAVRA